MQLNYLANYYDIAENCFRPPDAEFSIYSTSGKHEFHKVSHASPTGFVVFLPIDIRLDEVVYLMFVDMQINFEVLAVVEDRQIDNPWKEQHVRLKYFPDYAPLNKLYFMAIRKYLDPFDSDIHCRGLI